MKILIISAGPGIEEIRLQYGHAIDWISSFIDSSSIDIDIKNIYCNEDFDQSLSTLGVVKEIDVTIPTLLPK